MSLPSVEFLIVAGRAVFLIFSFVMAAAAFTAWRRAARTQTEQFLAQTNIVLQHLALLEARVDATKVAITQLTERLDQPSQPLPSAGNPAPGYQIAIRLAKGGATREELMSGCGLTLSEADLVQRLHGPPAATHVTNSNARATRVQSLRN